MMLITQRRMTCTACRHVFEAELVENAPVAIFLASLKSVRCPNCGVGYKKIGFGGAYSDSPPLTAPIKERANWWRNRGDVGDSSLTIWSAFTGPCIDHRNLGYPLDPQDFLRCKLLLDLIPEWRQEVKKVSACFRWWAPFVDRWDGFERLYAEESPGKKCPKLYELMQVAGKEAEAIRNGRPENAPL